MAITINTEPQSFVPGFNPVVFTLSSTNVAQSNFKYVCDIYINGSASRAARIKLPPNPTNTYAMVDISGVIQTYLGNDPALNVTDYEKNTNSLIYYQCQFGEEYGPDTSITTYVNLKTHSPKYSFNGSLTPDEYVDWFNVDTDFLHILSNVPTSIGMGFYDKFHVSATNNNTQGFYSLNIKSYDSSGNLMSDVELLNPYAALSNWQDKSLRFNIGANEINNFSGSITGVISGSYIIDPDFASYYTWQTLNNTGDATSDLYTVNLLDRCSNRYTPVRLYFQNKLGGYDAFSFEGSTVRNSTTERRSYKKQLGQWSSQYYVYYHQDRSNYNYFTQSKDRYTIQSNWISEDESTWLNELIDSPDVYIMQSDTLIPINILNNDYTFKTEARDKLFNLELQYEIANERLRQRR